jgi:ABC-type Fe3+/spermidine/putrescine transport system ATPase subunit
LQELDAAYQDLLAKHQTSQQQVSAGEQDQPAAAGKPVSPCLGLAMKPNALISSKPLSATAAAANSNLELELQQAQKQLALKTAEIHELQLKVVR